MKPFCMGAPEETAFHLQGSDTAYGDFLRVAKIHSILEGCTNIYVDFQGRVFNEPHGDC
jgi:hypothetical protein